MRRFSLIFLATLLPYLLLAQNSYKNALEFFKQGDYQESMNLLGALVAEGASQRDVYFYLGRSAFELGKYEIAEHAFREALQLDPENPRMHLELAATLFALKKYTESKSIFEELLEEPLPDTVKTNIRRHLALIRKDSSSRQRVVLGMGAFYDDNVHQSAGSSNVYVPVYDTVVDFGETKESDGGGQFLAGIEWRDGQRELPLGLSLWMFDRTYGEYSEEDLTYLRGGVSLYHFLESPLDVKLALGRMYDGGEPYAWDYEGGVEWKAREKKIATEVGVFWLKREHQELHETKDYQALKIKGSLQYRESNWRAEMGALFQRDWEDQAVRSDVDKAVMALWLGVDKKLFDEWILGGGYRFQSVDYTDTDAHFLTKRQDDQHQVHVSLKHSFSAHWLGELEWRHIRNQSNHAPYDYVKNRTGVWLVYAY